MAKLYLLVKRKSSNKYQGAIPVKKGVTVTKLKKALRGRVSSEYSVKIVTETQLKNYIRRLAAKAAKKSRSSKKKSKKKVRRKVKHKVKRKVRRKKRR